MLNRMKRLNDNEVVKKGPVVYWMNRDQRVEDNYALLFAQSKAEYYQVPLKVLVILSQDFITPTKRQYLFVLKGLKELEEKLNALNIELMIKVSEDRNYIASYLKKLDTSLLVTELNPLRSILKWQSELSIKTDIPFYTVDAHNIIPVFKTSDKLEYAAYTIRPKINRLLEEYLVEIPKMKPHLFVDSIKKVDFTNVLQALSMDESIEELDEFIPGETAAHQVLEYFIKHKLEHYETLRNDPNQFFQSQLSPYIHFGQISTQRIALEINKADINEELKTKFLDEIIIRKELCENYCYYNRNYDNYEGAHEWAKRTLHEHRNDEREFIYSLEEFEQAKTHENLWNAAQMQLVKSGKMNGFMRMYWAKKILEWTKSPEDAIAIAITLNDKYSIDGKDPIGYTGIMWSICGVHDRPWFERPIFGKIRYMNYNGCKRKFDVEQYINKWIK